MPLAQLTSRKMSLKEILPMINSLVKHVTRVVSPNAIYLIGSAARNEFTEYSDIDMVIVVSSDELRSARERVHIGRPFPEVAVDFLLMDAETFEKYQHLGGIAFEAKQMGHLLYEDTL